MKGTKKREKNEKNNGKSYWLKIESPRGTSCSWSKGKHWGIRKAISCLNNSMCQCYIVKLDRRIYKNKIKRSLCGWRIKRNSPVVIDHGAPGYSFKWSSRVTTLFYKDTYFPIYKSASNSTDFFKIKNSVQIKSRFKDYFIMFHAFFSRP